MQDNQYDVNIDGNRTQLVLIYY